jgi:hypothetical protein
MGSYEEKWAPESESEIFDDLSISTISVLVFL